MAATMQDVADRAGVSIATVSFVVNNTKNVTPQTRARIEQAMADLGFRRNLVARALASRRTRIVARPASPTITWSCIPTMLRAASCRRWSDRAWSTVSC